MHENKCKHERCACGGTDMNADGYCSPSCREGRTGADGRCACGHPSCK